MINVAALSCLLPKSRFNFLLANSSVSLPLPGRSSPKLSANSTSKFKPVSSKISSVCAFLEMVILSLFICPFKATVTISVFLLPVICRMPSRVGKKIVSSKPKYAGDNDELIMRLTSSLFQGWSFTLVRVISASFKKRSSRRAVACSAFEGNKVSGK